MLYVVIMADAYMIVDEEKLFEVLGEIPNFVDEVGGPFSSGNEAQRWAKAVLGSRLMDVPYMNRGKTL